MENILVTKKIIMAKNRIYSPCIKNKSISNEMIKENTICHIGHCPKFCVNVNRI